VNLRIFEKGHGSPLFQTFLFGPPLCNQLEYFSQSGRLISTELCCAQHKPNVFDSQQMRPTLKVGRKPLKTGVFPSTRQKKSPFRGPAPTLRIEDFSQKLSAAAKRAVPEKNVRQIAREKR
jgi:hypothetical protein